ncbi:tuliposide A-converting enzyme b1, amyloplastic-like [Panicum hallii]|uniref:tuliposide A-converting enzyme b1, amyloplastic-like n=1 Tax=Panicum hallii TaxID=206008 RepID=UPI000DF4DF55|nr:tuliposide A-converting enzyme b1, amyloplastic-like [Panicum hallii]
MHHEDALYDVRANKYYVDVVDEVDLDLSPFLKRYKDGRIERLLKSPFVAASDNPTANRGAATRDVVVDHGTGVTYHRYATSLVASAGAIVVSVEYCLAPEHPILAAYDDTWSELQWVASLADPWLADYADPARTFLTGDMAVAERDTLRERGCRLFARIRDYGYVATLVESEGEDHHY